MILNLVETRTFGGERRRKKYGQERKLWSPRGNKSSAITTIFSEITTDITSQQELKDLSTDLKRKFANLFRHPKLISL